MARKKTKSNPSPAQAGGQGRNATASKAPPRKNRGAPQPRRLNQVPAWVHSLKDPCNSRDVRIPDGQLFPTATGSMRIMRMISAPPLISGVPQKTALSFLPIDIQVSPGALNMSLLASQWNSPNDSSFFGSNQWAMNSSAYAQAPILTLAPLMRSARVVSSCVKVTYTGSALVNGGLITGFTTPPGQHVGNLAAVYSPDGENITPTIAQTSQPGLVRLMATTMSVPLREGLEVKKFPASRDELRFANAHPQQSVGLTDYFSFVETASSYGVLIDWSDASQQVMVEYTVNYEYIPRAFASANTKTVPMQVGVLNQVASIAQNIHEIIQPLIPVGASLWNAFTGRQAGIQGARSQVTIEDL